MRQPRRRLRRRQRASASGRQVHLQPVPRPSARSRRHHRWLPNPRAAFLAAFQAHPRRQQPRQHPGRALSISGHPLPPLPRLPQRHQLPRRRRARPRRCSALQQAALRLLRRCLGRQQVPLRRLRRLRLPLRCSALQPAAQRQPLLRRLRLPRRCSALQPAAQRQPLLRRLLLRRCLVDLVPRRRLLLAAPLPVQPRPQRQPHRPCSRHRLPHRRLVEMQPHQRRQLRSGASSHRG